MLIVLLPLLPTALHGTGAAIHGCQGGSCHEEGAGPVPGERGSQLLHVVWHQSAHKGVNQCLKCVPQIQQQRPESPTVSLTWHEYKYKGHNSTRGG